MNTAPDAEKELQEIVDTARADGRETIRLRSELRVYRPSEQRYSSLPGGSTNIDVRLEKAEITRQAFEEFLRALAERGPEEVIALLRQPLPDLD